MLARRHDRDLGREARRAGLGLHEAVEVGAEQQDVLEPLVRHGALARDEPEALAEHGLHHRARGQRLRRVDLDPAARGAARRGQGRRVGEGAAHGALGDRDERRGRERLSRRGQHRSAGARVDGHEGEAAESGKRELERAVRRRRGRGDERPRVSGRVPGREVQRGRGQARQAGFEARGRRRAVEAEGDHRAVAERQQGRQALRAESRQAIRLRAGHRCGRQRHAERRRRRGCRVRIGRTQPPREGRAQHAARGVDRHRLAERHEARVDRDGARARFYRDRPLGRGHPGLLDQQRDGASRRGEAVAAFGVRRRARPTRLEAHGRPFDRQPREVGEHLPHHDSLAARRGGGERLRPHRQRARRGGRRRRQRATGRRDDQRARGLRDAHAARHARLVPRLVARHGFEHVAARRESAEVDAPPALEALGRLAVHRDAHGAHVGDRAGHSERPPVDRRVLGQAQQAELGRGAVHVHGQLDLAAVAGFVLRHDQHRLRALPRQRHAAAPGAVREQRELAVDAHRGSRVGDAAGHAHAARARHAVRLRALDDELGGLRVDADPDRVRRAQARGAARHGPQLEAAGRDRELDAEPAALDRGRAPVHLDRDLRLRAAQRARHAERGTLHLRIRARRLDADERGLALDAQPERRLRRMARRVAGDEDELLLGVGAERHLARAEGAVLHRRVAGTDADRDGARVHDASADVHGRARDEGARGGLEHAQLRRDGVDREGRANGAGPARVVLDAGLEHVASVLELALRSRRARTD